MGGDGGAFWGCSVPTQGGCAPAGVRDPQTFSFPSSPPTSKQLRSGGPGSQPRAPAPTPPTSPPSRVLRPTQALKPTLQEQNPHRTGDPRGWGHSPVPPPPQTRPGRGSAGTGGGDPGAPPAAGAALSSSGSALGYREPSGRGSGSRCGGVPGHDPRCPPAPYLPPRRALRSAPPPPPPPSASPGPAAPL